MTFFKIIPLEERIVLDGAMAATVIYVNVHAAIGGDGTSWAHAFHNLQSALDKAAHTNGNEQIWVAAGTYLPTSQTISGDPNSKTFLVYDDSPNGTPDSVSIYGGFKGTEKNLAQRNPNKNLTVLSGDLLQNDLPIPNTPDNGINDTLFLTSKSDNARHVMTINQPNLTVVLDGLNVVDGFASRTEINYGTWSHGGAGILAIQGGTHLTLNNVDIKDNAALFPLTMDEDHFYFGAGFALVDPGFNDPLLPDNPNYLTLTNSILENNRTAPFHALGGGGVIVNGICNVDNVILRNNVTGHGSLAFNGGQVAINHVLVDHNTGEAPGIGLFGFSLGLGGASYSMTASVKNTTFSNQTDTSLHDGSNGLGLDIELSTVSIDHCSFINNTAVNSTLFGTGAGILVVGSSISINHSSFIDNQALSSGAAISGFFNQSIDITNNIFKYNQSGTLGGAIDIGEDTAADISNNIFIQNSAAVGGGAIHTTGEADLTISYNQFIKNSAGNYGGAIADDLDSGDLSLSINIAYNNFVKDTAPLASEIYLTAGSTVNGQTTTPSIIYALINQNNNLDKDEIEIV